MMSRADSFERFMAEVDYRPDPTPTVAEIARDEWLDNAPEGQAWWVPSVVGDGDRWLENETL